MACCRSAPDEHQWHVLPYFASTQLLVVEQSTCFSKCLSYNFYYGSKPQENQPLSNSEERKGGKVKNRRRAQPPPQLPTCSSDTEALGHDEDLEPSLRDVMSMLGNINARLTANEDKVDNLTSHSQYYTSATTQRLHAPHARQQHRSLGKLLLHLAVLWILTLSPTHKPLTPEARPHFSQTGSAHCTAPAPS